MCAAINCRTHIIAVSVLIAISGICLVQCSPYGGYSSYDSYHPYPQRYRPRVHNGPLRFNSVSDNSGKFEVVYRWKQMSYAPLDNGRFECADY